MAVHSRYARLRQPCRPLGSTKNKKSTMNKENLIKANDYSGIIPLVVLIGTLSFYISGHLEGGFSSFEGLVFSVMISFISISGLILIAIIIDSKKSKSSEDLDLAKVVAINQEYMNIMNELIKILTNKENILRFSDKEKNEDLVSVIENKLNKIQSNIYLTNELKKENLNIEFKDFFTITNNLLLSHKEINEELRIKNLIIDEIQKELKSLKNK